jgi:hypothetical protein
MIVRAEESRGDEFPGGTRVCHSVPLVQLQLSVQQTPIFVEQHPLEKATSWDVSSRLLLETDTVGTAIVKYCVVCLHDVVLN